MADNAKTTIARGERTRKWYENREVKRVFSEIKEDIFILWEKTASDQEVERERLYREIHGLKALEKRISKIVDNGVKAKLELENAIKNT